MDNENLMNVKQVSALLGVNTFTIYAWTRRKYMPFVKLGRVIRFRLSDIQKWLSDRAELPLEKVKHSRKRARN